MASGRWAAPSETARLDVTDTASIAETCGGRAFDIVINNAGVSHDSKALATSPEDWSRVIDTNLTGVFRVAQAVPRAMVAEGRGGSIINIASILGLRVAGNVAAYATAKAGVVQLTRASRWNGHGTRSALTRYAPAISRQTSIAISLPRQLGRRSSRAFRKGVSANWVISMARCCCSLPMLAPS